MAQSASESSPAIVPRWMAFAILFGAYLTLRGYHSFDGDQAYRLPLLLHRLDPKVYANDPFVRAFEVFNPHRGYLALLDLASRPFGLAAALAGLFALTWVATVLGIDRFARTTWPESGTKVGFVAVVLVLLAKAGNIGTNHLFEATLLDRLIGFALGWLAIASAVGERRHGIWIGAVAIGIAALIHPSVGLQIGLTLAAAWFAWALLPGASGVTTRQAAGAILALGLALIPGMLAMSSQGKRLFEGLPEHEFRSLAVLIQGPQHMLPSQWRRPQWLAWSCYPILAVVALARVGLTGDRAPASQGRVRLAILIAVNLASLLAAYLAVEVVGDLRVTIFQPFRMATLARGLALVALAGRAVALWNRDDWFGRTRVALLAVGLTGDRTMIVATAYELSMTAVDLLRARGAGRSFVAIVVIACGTWFLARHDTESGHIPILIGLAAVSLFHLLGGRRDLAWNRRRVVFVAGIAWVVPALAAIGPLFVQDPAGAKWLRPLVAKCRFAEIPTDDLERLAAWCRDHTPEDSLFIGPPGPKEFRLWSRRAVAFNRAASPYHARGLGDWAERYRDHVDFRGTTGDFIQAYLTGRHALEARFSARTNAELAALGTRWGATHLLLETRAGASRRDPAGPLQWLRSEGHYSVYRIRDAGTH
ncbi:DUF6798 domain-containing protein [Tundrisphaera sp. TA3]|uniref:DUF6798 domain-containing protein n=1 Tax=Tundrisphaera sp. TA3 TaxID=3435775 RepID=UPI003EBC1279